MIISKEPEIHKLELDSRIIEQIITLSYLGVEMTSSRNLIQEVTTLANKAAKMSGCRYGTIWKNKHMTMDSKMKIYKRVMRLILT